MANNIGTVQLEFFRPGEDAPAVIGTDCVVKVDARLADITAANKLYVLAMDYVKKNDSLEFRGTYYSIWRKQSERLF